MENRAGRRRRRQREGSERASREVEAAGAIFATFIRNSWESLAARAYESYLEQGRGAMLVDADDAADAVLSGASRAQFPAYYFTAEDLASVPSRAWAKEMPSRALAKLEEFTGTLVEQARTYDPEREIVVGFDTAQAGVLVVVASHPEGRTPPGMLEERRRQGAQIPRA